MEKLLHERLRDIEESDVCTPEKLGYGENCGNTYCNKCEVDMFNALADEIERNYIPRPRFEDGEPVDFRERMGNGAHVRRIIFHEDGWTVDSGKDGAKRYGSYNSGTCKTVPRYHKPVLDADGVEINVGDTVYLADDDGSVKFIVEGLPAPNAYQAVEIVSGRVHTSYDPLRLTHREPDSLKKLRDDIRKWLPKYSSSTPYETVESIGDEIEARFTALIERGA